MLVRAISYSLVCLLAFSAQAFSNDLVKKLNDISVNVKSGRGEGSGVLVVRKDGDASSAFVWTAAHVVADLRGTREIIDSKGVSRKVVEFKDAAIVQEISQDGRRVGEVKMEAQVIRYSDADNGEDLALLRVRKKNFVPEHQSATFYLKDEIPGQGTELYHVGSLLGQVGANSLTTGVIAQTGRVLTFNARSVVFDQTTVTAFPGSSGGGVFLKDSGEYMGMLVRGHGEQFNLIVPVRRMREWAKRAGIEFALDPRVKMPSDDELSNLPVEDSGIDQK